MHIINSTYKFINILLNLKKIIIRGIESPYGSYGYFLTEKKKKFIRVGHSYGFIRVCLSFIKLFFVLYWCSLLF